MHVYASYLLRTAAQAESFRTVYAKAIEKGASAIEEWFNAHPIYEWIPYRPRPGTERVTTGLLCLLYLERRINITFSRDMKYIQRGARDEQEYQEYLIKRQP